MSVDAGRFLEFGLDMHNVWSSPLQVSQGFDNCFLSRVRFSTTGFFQFMLGSYIAYRQVGNAIWAGVGYIILLSIVNGFVSRFYERFQVRILVGRGLHYNIVLFRKNKWR